MIMLTIPEATPSGNATLWKHWRVKHRERQHWGTLVKIARLEAKFYDSPRYPSATITIERHAPRLLDADNARQGCKGLLDSLKVEGLILDDTPAVIGEPRIKSGGILDSDPATLDRRIGIKLGLMPADLFEVKRRLKEGLLIDDKWQPVAWGKRQFMSDNSTARVQKHRGKRSGNVSETKSKRFGNAPDTDTDTDTEQRKRRAKRASRVPKDFEPDIEYARQQLPDIDAPREVQKFRDWEFKTPRSDWPAV